MTLYYYIYIYAHAYVYTKCVQLGALLLCIYCNRTVHKVKDYDYCLCARIAHTTADAYSVRVCVHITVYSIVPDELKLNKNRLNVAH